MSVARVSGSAIMVCGAMMSNVNELIAQGVAEEVGGTYPKLIRFPGCWRRCKLARFLWCRNSRPYPGQRQIGTAVSVRRRPSFTFAGHGPL